MFKKHLRIFQRSLYHKKIPAVLITSKSDIFYLSGSSVEGIALIITPKSKAVYAGAMLNNQVKCCFPGWHVGSDKDFSGFLHAYLKSTRISRLCVDKEVTTIGQFHRLKKTKRKIKIMVLSSLLVSQRMIKTSGEIERIRKACGITARIFRSMPSYFNKSRTEQDLAGMADILFLKTGARNAFETIVSYGSATAEPHHTSGSFCMLVSGPLMIDAGCVFNGYSSDLTRTYYLGKMSKLYRQINDLVCLAKDAAQRVIRPGIGAAQIDAAARSVFKKAGLDKYFIHSTGHGVGIDVHEAPQISPKSKDVLQPGMVITIEPGLYIPGKCGVRIEDTILVTKTGYEILTK